MDFPGGERGIEIVMQHAGNDFCQLKEPMKRNQGKPIIFFFAGGKFGAT